MTEKFPLELADLCVKCGLCAPHCPTYQLDKMEPESPRGRLAIMQGIAQAQLDASPKAQTHLDHCLSCQACEAVCPAKVPYLQLLDHHRALHPTDRWQDRWLRRVLRLQHGRGLLRLTLRILRRIRPGLQAMARRLGLHRSERWLSLAPAGVAPRRWSRTPQAQVQLLPGCLGDLGNAQAIEALRRCCEALDIRLDVLPPALCCGALDQHQGADEQAQRQQTKLAAALDPHIPLLSLDSACTQQLRSHAQAVDEVCAYLAAQDWSAVRFRPTSLKVLIHQPCSHRNGLRDGDAARRLLQRIPGLQLEDMPDPLCCGAAGNHMLRFPERADRLLAPKLEAARSGDYDVLLTTNIGCALHLAGGLRRAAAARPRLLHPVQLIAELLDD